MSLLSAHAVSAVVQLDTPVELSIEDASVTLDDSWAPYGQARLTCFTPADLDVLDEIDPKEDIRVTLDLARTLNLPSARSFDLGLRSREIDHEAGTMVLELATDEALLQDYTLLTTATERTYGLSVRTAVAYALAKISAALYSEPTLTNLVPNPSGETATTGYTISAGTGGTAAITNPTSTTAFGSKVIRATWSVASTAGNAILTYSTTSVTAGHTYSFGIGHVRASVAKTLRFLVNWYTSGGGFVGQSTNVTVAVSAGVVSTGFKLEGVVAPPTAGKADFIVIDLGAVWPVASYLEVDGLLLVEASTLPAYFDGSSTDGTDYTYAWTGTANASTSTKALYLFDGTLESDAVEAVRTNLFTNPNFEAASTGFTNNLGGAQARSSTVARTDTYSMAVTRSAATDDYVYVNIAATAGTTYVISAWVRHTANGASQFSRGLHVENVGGVVATQDVAYSTTLNTWERMSVTFTAPASTTALSIRFYAATSTTVYVDNLLITAGSDLIAYFDGGNLDGRVAGLYATAWTGTANASTSTLTNLSHTDATIWAPGVSAWKYVEPLLQATNLKLYCDENRVWHLIEGTLVVDGVVTVAEAFNLKAGRELISRDDAGDWYLGVAIKYAWTDAEGEQQVAYDVAGDPSKVLVLEYERPYPGPGAAAYVLGRAEGKGRVYDLTAMSAYDAQPGKQLVATLPNTSIQVGVVSGVTWRFPQHDMSVKSRGLTEAPADAWLFADDGLAWDEIAVGVDWTEYTP
ncbi:MAG: hypothetical protein JWP85_995 [Rhodoglobus sp.]|nr:hypothetical protein [Rhodoglobus sp.]